MSSSNFTYGDPASGKVWVVRETDIETDFVRKLEDLKYTIRRDIRDRQALEANFREKFEALNRDTLTDGEFGRLLDEIVKPDVYESARALRNRETFVRDDGTPLNYTLVNIKNWCKNSFEVVNQLRINTDNSQLLQRPALRAAEPAWATRMHTVHPEAWRLERRLCARSAT